MKQALVDKNQLSEDEIELYLAEARQRDLEKIQQDAEALDEATTHVAKLVAEQQPQVDNIEDNVSRAVENTDIGSKALESAATRSNRKRWITAIVVGLLAVGGGIMGGYPVGVALGYSGFAATICGFGIIAGAILGVSLLAFGIYSIVNAVKTRRELKNAERAELRDEVIRRQQNHDTPSPRPAARISLAGMSVDLDRNPAEMLRDEIIARRLR
jgi:membrane protein implicated in regulation of membrane protease activity